MKQYKYTGTLKPQSGETDPKTGEKLFPYLPDPELIKAVNLAIALKRPLLLEGEPGGGKTELARAVAYELKLDYQYYCVKSTSKAVELLYTFDTIAKLRDAQLAATNQLTPEQVEKIKQAKTYIQLGVLGEAFLAGAKNNQRTVVLIDEIDKADLDFPNDLLQELDKMKLTIPELKNQSDPDPDIPAEIIAPETAKPIIFITSNSEKKLSDAFLRRCLYYYVKFPDEQRLTDIVQERFGKKKIPVERLNQALKIFVDLRQRMDDDEEERMTTKKISTSEWIDWIDSIIHNPDEFDRCLETDVDQLPFAEVLLKSQEDRNFYLQLSNFSDGF